MTAQADNKFAALFRPRSRSRPYHHPTLSDPMSSVPHKDAVPDNPPSSYAKSSVRSQNRPISSTTTATHSTITPLPSDVLRNRMHRGRHPYPLHPHRTDTHSSLVDHDHSSDTIDLDSNDHRFPRSETPSSAGPKRILHSLFGFSLTRRSNPHQSASTSERKGSTSTSASEQRSKSSRKRSFRLTSRPSTPKSVDDPPSKSPHSIPVPSSPLPLSASPRRRSFGLGGSQRSTPKSSTGNLPLPHVQSPQGARAHGRRHSVGSERPPHDSAVALPEEPSHRSVHKGTHLLPDGGSRNRGKEREKIVLDSERPLPDVRPSVEFPSQSLPRNPSSISRNYLVAGHSVSSQLPVVDSASSDENEQASFLAPHPLPMIPRIIHTPPTPQRLGGEIDSPSRPTTVDSGKAAFAKGKAAAIAHREQVLVSSSQSHADAQHTASSKGRFTPRFFSGKDLPRTKDGDAVKSSKQAAAGSSNGLTHKTPGSNAAGPPRNMTNHRGKLGSFDFERPVSALNKSSSTVDRQGTKDNSSYSKTRLHSLERTISADSARAAKSRLVAHHPEQAELPVSSQLRPVHTGDTSVVSFSSVSVQTKSTGKNTGSNTPAEQSSSWGRASGRRILRSSHGTFAFEHPSSLPSSPSPHAFNLPSGQNDLLGHMSGRPQRRPTTPLHAIFDARMMHSRGQSHNTSDHVEADCSKPVQHKSKGKGRSLDLGLGLSWAPSRVREEVLMPGFILAREKAKLEKNKANGLDVTKVFESLLSETRFQTFKKYVHRFDAHIIPLEGPSGLLARVEKLLTESGLSERERNNLMAEFSVFVENHGG